jgi:hypothetical protein
MQQTQNEDGYANSRLPLWCETVSVTSWSQLRSLMLEQFRYGQNLTMAALTGIRIKVYALDVRNKHVGTTA